MTDIYIPFGKHRGASLDEVPSSYLDWMLAKASSGDAWAGLVDFVEEHHDAIIEAVSASSRALLNAANLDYELNPSQLEASHFLAEWLDGPEPAAKLEGGAGYGKSFTTLDVVKRAIERGYRVKAMAPSYVATQVLASQLDQLLGNDGTKTIARTLRLDVEYDGPTENYVPGDDTYKVLPKLLGRGNLLVVDEGSMVSDDLGRLLLGAAQEYGGKLLVVLDSHQLPPVGQSKDSILCSIPVSTELTQPMRYADSSPLFELEQNARHSVDSVLIRADWEHAPGAIEVHDGYSDLLGRYVRDLKAHPVEDARMMFFSRKDVAKANADVRHQLHGDVADNEPLIEDERLLVMGTTNVVPYRKNEHWGSTFKPTAVGTPDCTVRLYSGESFLVEDVQAWEVQVEHYAIPCYMVKLHGRREYVPVIFGTSESTATGLGAMEYQRAIKDATEQGKEGHGWGLYWAVKRSVALVNYSYAMTVHRCQGQTVDRAYLMPRGLRHAGGSRMGAKLLYVAATRARRQVHLVLPPEPPVPMPD